MGSTIVDFENLCNADVISENSSPDTKKNEKQIQLLSSADQLPKSMRHQNGNSGKKKKRKSKKSSKKNGGNKTPAFSFEYNRGTVSSKNKKARLGSKKKKKKEKLGKKKKKKKKKK